MWNPKRNDVHPELSQITEIEPQSPLPRALLKFRDDLEGFEHQVKEARFIQSRLHVLIRELEELILKK